MLPTDLDLQVSQIQTLSNRDAIVALSTSLGYNTQARLVQTAAAMGFTGDALAHEITHIERIADQEQGEFQVYLLEMKHVTVALTQALARALRNRAGMFLLVLTADYAQIDFVLMELIEPQANRVGFGAKQAYLRPRVLTIDRRNPGTVNLRVLRRFSYTEIDPLYQWDKLRSAYGIAEWSEPYFENRALFADYYLTERLTKSAEWNENPASALRAFQKLLVDARQRLNQKSEATVRAELIEPALKTMGFVCKPGKASHSDAAEPDYILCDTVGTSIGFCAAYVWGRNLDGRDETRDSETPEENPGALVVSLLEREGIPNWGIITNGKTWLLYSARTHSRATNYYEIDLEEAVNSPDPQFAFRYFWLIFRAMAFRRDGETKSFLDRLVDESELYAKQLGERLKDRVFEEVFPQFAEGFITHIRAREGVKADLDPERLDQVFHGTLTYLYRLLFLLYAEARELLPVRDVRGYYRICLTRLKQEIAQHGGTIVDMAPDALAKTYSATSTELYDRLAQLFGIVDNGSVALNVPLYNGGLLITNPTPDDMTPEAANARFLAANKIPDRYLVLGLDRMARDIDDKLLDLVMIDYKSLGVRQLGSIYEGLLEFKVRIAPEKMAVVKGKKTEEIVPFREAKEQHVRKTYAKGKPYLENDKHERKASGSYYTPDYIVKYIVEHTVGPVIETKCEALRPKLRAAQKAHRAAIDRHKAFVKAGDKGDDPEKVANTFRGVVDELFDLRVLDPAMGSGHFLVETVDFVTDRMLYFLNAFPWNPVTAALRQTRETILTGMQEQGVTIDESRLTDVNLLKRHILKRCIYGVDLNPMAVELAKVSLWLDCFTLGAPLSFLDHHLKCGNSLIGARITEVQAALDMAAEKDRVDIPMLAGLMGSQFAGVMLATDLMRQVGELSDVTAAQVKASRAEFRRATDALAPFKRILDIYTSRWFGNQPNKAQSKAGLEPAIDFLRRDEANAWLRDPEAAAKTLKPEMKKTAAMAIQSAADKRFFHWELEFPEVFFGPSKASAQEIASKENAGFDVVVGNPPYRDLKDLDRDVVSMLFMLFDSTKNRANIYAAFVSRAVALARTQGQVGVIVPNSWLTQSSYAKLKDEIVLHMHLHHLVRVPETAFPEQKVETTIVVAKKGAPSINAQTAYVGYEDNMVVQTINPANAPFSGVRLQSEIAIKGGKLWTSQGKDDDLLSKIDVIGDELVDICDFSLGLTPYDKYSGHTEAQIREQVFHASYKRDVTYKPLLTGGDISRYVVEWGGREWISYGDWLGAPRVQRFFMQPRILVKQIVDWTTRRIHAGYTSEELYNAQIAFNLVPKRQETHLFLISILNSQLVTYYHSRRFLDVAKIRFQKVLIQDAKRFRIRRIHFTTPSAERKARLMFLVTHCEQNQESRLLGEVECLLSKDASGAFLAFKPGATGAEEHSDVIHDLLAYLAEQMIEMNKQKQAEQKRFLGWLEGVLKVSPDKEGNTGLDALTGKTTLRGYLGDYQKGEESVPFDAIVDVLRKNRTRIGISTSEARFVAKLKGEYEKSLGVLLPIKERLARTDTLIDQVVYRLYGLTEEEIKVVEGKG